MPAADKGYAPQLAYDPASSAAAVTTHDTNELANLTTRVFVGGAGNIKVTMMDGTDVTFTGVIAGSVLPIRVRRIFATGTTATNIVAMW